jgi:hypothetical protein
MFLALRLYYFLIPLFAWIFSVWVLAAVGLFYLLLVHRLEDISFMEKEIDDALDLEGNKGEGYSQLDTAAIPAPLPAAAGGVASPLHLHSVL